jgi:hypothetical protein
MRCQRVRQTSKSDYDDDNDNEKTIHEPSFSGLTGESRRPPPATQPDALDARLRGRDEKYYVFSIFLLDRNHPETLFLLIFDL